MSIPDAILKKPGKLTDEEFKVMQTYAETGFRILDHFHEEHGRHFWPTVTDAFFACQRAILQIHDTFRDDA